MPIGVESQVERCQRCFQPVPATVKRCPHCGDVVHRAGRKLMLYAGVIGLLLAALLVGLALYLHQDTPEPDQLLDQGAPAQRSSPPPPPEKRPALDR